MLPVWVVSIAVMDGEGISEWCGTV